MGGVRTLACIMRRGAGCEVSGCWVWTGFWDYVKTPRVKIDGVSRTARRAAAILAGHRLTKKQRVVVKKNCDPLCVNPDHLQALNGGSYISWQSQVSTMNGPSHHAARTAKRRAGSVIKTVEAADELRRRVAEGEDRGAVAQSAGITRKHLNEIVRGVKWGASSMPAGASVFSWAASL